MTDGFGRTIDYLRISVTDKCNLRCKYCMPPEGVRHLPHEEILTLEEIARLSKILAGLGIKKVRLTGGEPMVRKNLLWLVKALKEDAEINEIAMTTNGILFAQEAQQYREAGLSSINISLDTLEEESYAQITGKDMLSQVLLSIEAALEQGLQVKINCVPVKEWNEEELVKLAGIAKEKPVDVRFIELMPIGCGKEFEGIPSEEILKKLERVYGRTKEIPKSEGQKSQLLKDNEQNSNMAGPAKYVEFENFQGRIGFISPLSHKFCSECNRIRLTCDGKLKLCLHYQKGLELKPLLRGGATDEDIEQAIEAAVMEKPGEHHFLKDASKQEGKPEENSPEEMKKMVQIGG